MKRKSRNIARSVRYRVMRSSERFWHTSEFSGSRHAVAMELSRLVEAGELERVRRGLYWRGRRTRFGMTPYPAARAVAEVTGKDHAVGPAAWSATNLLHLSTQVPVLPIIAVPDRAPTGIERARLISRAGREGRVRARLTSIEVAVLEAIDGWERFVEVDDQTATSILIDVLRDLGDRVSNLVKAAVTETEKVRERLRELLTRAGFVEEARDIARARCDDTRARALAVLGSTA